MTAENRGDSSTKLRAKLARYDRANAEAAAIIASDPARYGPALVEWARRWMSRHGREQEFLPRHRSAA
jgi:hypothetical protein